MLKIQLFPQDQRRTVGEDGGCMWLQRGGTPDVPPRPKSGKSLQKSQSVSQFQLSNGYYSSNLDDLAFFYKFQSIFSKKFKHFQQSFSGFAGRLLSFTCPMEIVPQFLMSLHFSTNFSRFSEKNFKNFHPISNSPPSKPFFELF